MARYDVNGSLDAGFGSGGLVRAGFSASGDDEATSVALQSDGKIVVTGFSTYDSGSGFMGRRVVVARYHGDGSLDSGFGTNGAMVTGFSNYASAQSVGCSPTARSWSLGRPRPERMTDPRRPT